MLEKEIQIGHLILRNRLVMAPVDFELSDLGTVSARELAYYDARTASGDIGLVVAEHAYVHPNGRAVTNQLSIAKDADVPGLTQLVDLVHGNKTPIFLQLSHGGARIMCSNVSVEGISPSGLPTPMPGAGKGEPIKTHAMSLEEIAELKEEFVQAALRAKAAGADGIELHMAHGYLLDQFYSPLTNQRTDQYGGPVENRVRVVTELLRLLRENVGDEMVLGVRLGACDYLPGGNTLADGAKAAALLAQAGAQYISVSGGQCGAQHPQNTGVGFFKEAAEAIKQVVQVPVLLTGGVKTRTDAESLLAAGAADMVGVARALIQNPNWANEAFAE
ncbi:MAG: NADH:flavin oxidoreductase [Acidaminococcaceae bacterium]|jgi:2,4-dienoyl-CoA reductase-like NADH-dependent reductase (Old Yellow Enzyme family)|nr:NADH:flavin oxidoreductase [Acidaminococcaceae bacterium]